MKCSSFYIFDMVKEENFRKERLKMTINDLGSCFYVFSSNFLGHF